MDSIMKPGDEITGHIRWEQPVLSLWGYVAGETELSTFKIQCPEDGGQDWTLTSTLPGQRDWRLYCDRPDALRKAAEGWVAEFVSSLGAIFPTEPANARPSRAWHADWAMVDRDSSGNAILRHKPTGGRYKVLPVEEC